MNWKLARTEFSDLLAEYAASANAPEEFSADVSFDAILSGELSAIEERLEKAKKYAHRLSADLASAKQGHVFVNGKHYDLDDVRLFFHHLLECDSQETIFDIVRLGHERESAMRIVISLLPKNAGNQATTIVFGHGCSAE